MLLMSADCIVFIRTLFWMCQSWKIWCVHWSFYFYRPLGFVYLHCYCWCAFWTAILSWQLRAGGTQNRKEATGLIVIAKAMLSSNEPAFNGTQSRVQVQKQCRLQHHSLSHNVEDHGRIASPTVTQRNAPASPPKNQSKVPSTVNRPYQFETSRKYESMCLWTQHLMIHL